MISRSQKFLFIQIPKTATVSVFTVLQQYMNKDVFGKFRHLTYQQASKDYPESKNYFKFSFVRNPWDRLLSSYLYARAIKKRTGERSIPLDTTLKNYLLKSPNRFSQYSFVDGFDKNSFIGRFENLQSDFDIVCDKIGIPRIKLERINKTKHTHYTDYYNNETRDIVSQLCAKDIEYFGYKFGE